MVRTVIRRTLQDLRIYAGDYAVCWAAFSTRPDGREDQADKAVDMLRPRGATGAGRRADVNYIRSARKGYGNASTAKFTSVNPPFWLLGFGLVRASPFARTRRAGPLLIGRRKICAWTVDVLCRCEWIFALMS